MKLINNKAYLEVTDLERIGLSANYIKSAVSREVGGWVSIKDPEDGRRLMVEWDGLSSKYKEAVIKSLGGKLPHEVLQEEMIMRMLKVDISETSVLVSQLGEQRARSAAKSAALLRWYLGISGKSDLRNLGLGIDKKEYLLDTILSIAQRHKLEGLGSISNKKVLTRKLAAFKEKGTAALINGRFGIANRRKVDAETWAQIGELYVKHNKPDSFLLTERINEVLIAMERPTICRSTVYNVITDPEFKMQYDAERDGNSVWRNQFDITIKRERPTMAGAFWMIDGSPIELYYNDNGKMGRWYGILVVDAYDWRIAGLHLCESETKEGVMAAVKNACYTQGLLPHQLQYDHSSALMSADIQAWLNDIATYNTPARVGNARAKTIEPFFNSFNKQILQRYDNWAGAGITAKRQSSKVNQDWLKANFKHLPNKEAVKAQIEQAVKDWNAKVQKPNNIAEGKHREFDSTMAAYLFWTFRMSGEKKVEYTYGIHGLKFVLNKRTYFYRVTDDDGLADINFHLQHIGNSFNVKYDPDDLTAVWLYHGDKAIALAEEIQAVPMAIVDRKEGDGEKIAAQMKRKEEIVEERNKRRSEAKQKAAEMQVVAESLAKAPFVVGKKHKDAYNNAESDLKDRWADLYDEEVTMAIVKN